MKNFTRVLGVVLILTAVTLFFWQDIREVFTDRLNNKIIEGFVNDDDDIKVNALEKFITGVKPSDKAGINIKDDMVGILKIESANIFEPVYYGPLTEEKLRNGVGLLEETDNLDMQNIPIAGHRVEGAGIRFNYIDKARVGDTIEFITRDGVRKYKIYDMYEVSPTDVDVLDQHEGDPQILTLITCEDYNPDTLLFEKRLIVQAEIIDKG
ncbi:class D sortase [Phocicoccus pinnipedialis]|uniref:Sortase family protein n=1 Tax=Phocicoccus pinnipedialis TaxID=110845 RepID=A0A6V7RHR3_9BACL|nr:class D sortase [Jeotgalicoccus pinnipedialis]MBP1939083.1 sortase A [Jeotgalicoccus pinnipedialis]CAD2076877.1 Sortase family protein [Jeotgalicoccus pinnipedialis]